MMSMLALLVLALLALPIDMSLLHTRNQYAENWSLHLRHILLLLMRVQRNFMPCYQYAGFQQSAVAGGQLAQFLRIRYPDVFAGAISSSAASFGCPGVGLVS